MRENSDANFSHLLLLYDEVYKSALEVRKYIENDAMSELGDIIKRQGLFIQKAIDFERQMPLRSEQKKEQAEIKNKIALMHKENINFMKIKQEEVRKSIGETSRESQLKKAYSFSQGPSGFSVDVVE